LPVSITVETGFNLAPEKYEDDQHDGQQPKHHHCNGESVNFPHQESVAFDKPSDSLTLHPASTCGHARRAGLYTFDLLKRWP